jgi:hypothetical protein
MLGNITADRLIEQEKVNKRLSQATNLDLEKKVAELAKALKHYQDEKKTAEEALDRSRKDLEKVQETHDDDLRLIENLRKDHDNTLKTAEKSLYQQQRFGQVFKKQGTKDTRSQKSIN